ncbi:hypothetical protein EGW08_015652, partial [Elysia chlorotica]
ALPKPERSTRKKKETRSSESVEAVTPSQPGSGLESRELSRYQMFPDGEHSFVEDFASNSSTFPTTSTPQNDKVPFLPLKTPSLQNLGSIFPETSAGAVSGGPSQSSVNIPGLPRELGCQKGQIVVLPQIGNSSLPITGIFYPFENSPAASQKLCGDEHPYPQRQFTQSAPHSVRQRCYASPQSPHNTSISRTVQPRAGFSPQRASLIQRSVRDKNSSCDLLAQTLKSCGISEDMSNLSPIQSTAPVPTSPVSSTYGKINSTVRNLRGAFDATDSNCKSLPCHQSYNIERKTSQTNFYQSDFSKAKSTTANLHKTPTSLSAKISANEASSTETFKIKLSPSQSITVLSLKNIAGFPVKAKMGSSNYKVTYSSKQDNPISRNNYSSPFCVGD